MISTPPDIYTDLQGLSRLRNLTRQDSAGALEEVARQFEALFLQMVLKGARDSSFGDPLFDDQQMDFYRDLHDQQLSVELARGSGMGIARMLVEQLGGARKTGRPDAVASFPVPERQPLRAAAPLMPEAETAQPRENAAFGSPREFVERLLPEAGRAAARLGVSPGILLAQAALETGWGKKIIRQGRDGSSHNLFNIKADRRWKGERVSVPTLEYVEGSMVRQQASFRAYGSYEESFADYVNFLRGNPRYAEALKKAGDDAAFVTALQRAGYATDPRYAEKVMRIANGPVLRDAVKFSYAAADTLL